LLDGGFANPLATYERAFVGTEGETTLCRHLGEHLTLRFPDPLDRTDAAGRIIPHDFVVPASTAIGISSPQVGLKVIWPMVSDTYAEVWDAEKAPSASDVRSLIARSRLGNDNDR